MRDIVRSTIEGLTQEGVKGTDAVRGSIGQAMHQAKEAGLDLGEVAVIAVKGAIDSAQKTGEDVAALTVHSIETALETAETMGADAYTKVKDTLKRGVDGAEDIVDSLEEKK